MATVQVSVRLNAMAGVPLLEVRALGCVVSVRRDDDRASPVTVNWAALGDVRAESAEAMGVCCQVAARLAVVLGRERSGVGLGPTQPWPGHHTVRTIERRDECLGSCGG